MTTWDLHVHSRFSWDAGPAMSAAACAERAARLGLAGIALTDHVDSTPARLVEVRRPTGPFDYGAYLDDVERAREQSRGGPAILTGVEYGEPHLNPDAFTAFVDRWNPDVVNASIHALVHEGALVAIEDLAAHTTPDELMARALTETLRLLDLELPITSLSHLDYPLRFFSPDTYDPEVHHDLFTQVLESATNAGVAIEISTRRGTQLFEWLLRLRGDRAISVSIGSDAHRLCDIGTGTVQAHAWLAESGLRPSDRAPHLLYRHQAS